MSSPSKKKLKTGGDTGVTESGAAAPPKASSREAGIILGIVCFFSGASVMVIEITGNRLLAPVFGNSLYTWTALIGVVLIAFSVGGYLGGWLVDRSPKPRVLGMLLFSSALMTLLIPALHTLVQGLVVNMGVVSGPVVLSLVLFMVPGVLLGSITPFTIRLLSMITADTRIGSAAGVIGMLGSLGSFVGTFASGFYLIPTFGVRQIFLFTGILLLLLAALIMVRFKAGVGRQALMMMAGLCVLGGTLYMATPMRLPDDTVYSKLTFYHSIRVFDQPEGAGKTARYLQLDTTTEGGQIVETGELNLAYQHYWTLSEPLGDGMKRALFIGAGAFGMPQHLARRWPDATVDVVEIDPEVIRVGYEHFRLGEYENVKAQAMDARRFVATSENEYDFIFGDAYSGVRNIPAHLTTKEFFETTKARLSERGVFVMNVISGITGERNELFRAMYATLDAVFENIEVFSTSPGNYVTPHNVIFLASARELGSFIRYVPGEGEPDGRVAQVISTRVDPAVYTGHKGVVLTDDRNPVEYIVATGLE